MLVSPLVWLMVPMVLMALCRCPSPCSPCCWCIPWRICIPRCRRIPLCYPCRCRPRGCQISTRRRRRRAPHRQIKPRTRNCLQSLLNSSLCNHQDLSKNLDPKPKHAINPKAPPPFHASPCETKLVLPTQIFCWEITVFTSKKQNCILCEELSRYR